MQFQLFCFSQPKDADFSILLANRSAALYHMQRYDYALQDIELAEENYPAEMMYKLKERKARCFLANKSYENALNAFKWVWSLSEFTAVYTRKRSCNLKISQKKKFQTDFPNISGRETITHLDNSKLPMEKRGKLEKDAQIMIKMLPQQVELEKKNRSASRKTDSQLQSDTRLNKSVDFDYTEHEGRFTKTLNNIAAGEEVLAERGVCAVLMERFSKSHCQHCFAR